MSDYTPLRITTIKPYTDIKFDLYIFFKERFLLYRDTGKELDDELLGKLKSQKIARFFITAGDEPNYQKYLDELLSNTLNDDSVSVDEKTTVVEGVACTAVERMKEDPNSRAAYHMTEQAAGSVRQVVSNKDALKLIFGKKAEEDDIIVKHCLNVSALSTKLAEKRNLPDEIIDHIATAGLMHDLAVTRWDASNIKLFKTPKSDLSVDDLKKYNSHPKETVTLLQDKPYVNEKIIDLILNHEETLSGSGPNKKLKLEPEEAVISIVDNYDKKVTIFGNSPKEALKMMQVDELGNFELSLINDLKDLLKIENVI